MVLTDNCGAYTVKLDYSHSTAEILDTATGESIVFMQGEEAEDFQHEYARIPEPFVAAYLSEYDFRHER